MVGAEGRSTRQPAGRGSLARARVALGLGQDPPLPRPDVARLEPLRRSWLAAAWQARTAVRAGVALDDYLRARLARYQAALPISPAHLPLEVSVEDGQLAVRALTERPPAPGADDDFLAPLAAIDGPSVRQEAQALEVRLALLEGDLEAARRRRDALEERVAGDIAAGLLAGAPSVDATAEQLGRPPVRSGAHRAALGLFAVAAVAAEAWYVAAPLFAGAGIDVRAPPAELAARPAELLFGGIFALGVAIGLVALASAALAALAALAVLARGEPEQRRARALGGAALAAVAGALLLASAVAALPGSGTPGLPVLTRTLLLVAVSASAALALRAARRESDARAADEAAALAWDRERARALEDRARRLDEVQAAERALDALEGERDAARRRLRDLGARAGLAARRAARAEEAGRAARSRVARSLVAALELDRHEFVRQASARGAGDLLAPRRRAPERLGPADRALEPAAAPIGRAVAS